MKIDLRLEDNFIDVWNVEEEKWDRYIKINEKQNTKIKKIEEPTFDKGRYYIKDINGDKSEISGIERTLRLKINEIIDYLESQV